MSENRSLRDQNTLENCDFVKTILMLIVVIYHSCAFWLSGGWFKIVPTTPNIFLGLLVTWLNSFHIYGFTLVSGYLFFYLKFEKNKYNDRKQFVIAKAKRLIVPYIFVATVWVIPWQVFFYQCSIDEIINKYILAINASQLWFLWMLFCVFIIAELIPSKIYKNSRLTILLALGLYAIGIVGGIFFRNYFQVFTACKYYLIFVVGMMIRAGKLDIVLKVPTYIWIIIDLLVFFLSRWSAGNKGAIFTALTIGLQLLLHVIGAIMVVCVLNGVANSIEWKNNRGIMFLKKHNFTIYLFHQQIIFGILLIIGNKVPSYILVITNFFVAILIASIISIILHKWKITRVLLGEKN